MHREDATAHAVEWLAVAAAAVCFMTFDSSAKSAEQDTGASPTSAQAENANVATVNGAHISQGLFAAWVEESLRRDVETLTAEERTKALESLVDLFVAAQEAQKQGLAQVADADRLELHRQSLLADALLKQKVTTIVPTDQDLKAEYDRQVAAMPPREYKARQILVAEEADAKKAIARIKNPAAFAKVAKEISIDRSKEAGGELGWFSLPQIPAPLARAIEELKKGEMTAQPVKSDYGWHVILLEDIRPVTPPPFAEVKERVAPLLQERILKEYVDQLRAASQVKTYATAR